MIREESGPRGVDVARAMLRKTLLVDDHVLFRQTLLLLLEQRVPGSAWREAGSLSSALQLLAGAPDIRLVLLDLDLPDSRGLHTLDRVRDAAPLVPVVVVSAHDTPEEVHAAIDRGAAGFLSKTVDAEQFVRQVQRVLAGEVIVPASVAIRQSEGMPQIDGRQRDVLRLLIEGKSNKLIARELGVGEATVKTHLQVVFRKLGVHSRTQALLAAARWRLTL